MVGRSLTQECQSKPGRADCSARYRSVLHQNKQRHPYICGRISADRATYRLRQDMRYSSQKRTPNPQTESSESTFFITGA